METPAKKQTYTDYKSRVNNVFDYVEANIDKDISLEELASVSHFSKCHFSRIFEAMDFWLTADQNPDLKEYEHEYARLWQDTQRMVFSKTLDNVKGKAKLFREVDPEEIRKLKSQPGNDMGVGGANLASTFIKHDLGDEFRLYIHPVALGGGKSMFPIDKKLNLEFIETKTFSCEVVMLKYQYKT